MPPSLLESISSPDDLRALGEGQLVSLASELRAFMIDTVSQTGGHLAPSLGTIELTIALHYVFNTPFDRLIWDVGHQAYAHKILTGRREAMATLRCKGGISGFPKRSESEYDTFGVGHSSTSVSAALGMALAAHQRGERRRVVAIIGDGAMGAGQAFEGLNHAGDIDADLLVVLNDNRMSISPNVGGLSNHLARILSGPLYSTVREGSKRVLSAVPPVRELARRAEEHMKGMVVPGTLFEELGFNYIGPIDGHDMPTLVQTLRNLHQLRGPRLLHVITSKGRGYPPAEADPLQFHGVGRFDPSSGAATGKPVDRPTFTRIFGDWLCETAEENPDLIAITPAMCEGSGMGRFASEHPGRFFDTGIAEQHAVTLAAGFACEGLRPVVAIYSTFLQRGYDQLIHDVALQQLPVLFAIDRAGVVGPDGPTHAGVFDIPFLRCIPEMVIMAPADEEECRRMLATGLSINRPSAVRYPRGHGPGRELAPGPARPLPLAEAEIVIEGEGIALLVFGPLLEAACAAASRLSATVVNMRFIEPLDRQTLTTIAASHPCLVTIEEGAIQGGAGSGVGEWLQASGLTNSLLQLGIHHQFTGQGSRDELLSELGLDSTGIVDSICRRWPDRTGDLPQPPSSRTGNR